GQDDYTVRALARAVEARYADPAGAPGGLRLDGATTPRDDVVSACRLLPFLSAHHAVRLGGLIGASSQRRARAGDEPAAAVAGRLGGSLWAISSAIDTLMAYAGAGGRITPAAVSALVAPDEDANVFHLTDAIAGRQAGRALTLLHTLLATGTAQEQVLAMLV